MAESARWGRTLTLTAVALLASGCAPGDRRPSDSTIRILYPGVRMEDESLARARGTEAHGGGRPGGLGRSLPRPDPYPMLGGGSARRPATRIESAPTWRQAVFLASPGLERSFSPA